MRSCESGKLFQKFMRVSTEKIGNIYKIKIGQLLLKDKFEKNSTYVVFPYGAHPLLSLACPS